MTTLGERLAAQNEARADAGLARQRADTAEKLRKVKENEEQIRLFNRSVIANIENRIENDLPIKEIRLPQALNFGNEYNHVFTGGEYRAIYDELKEWGMENGLIITFAYRHDGIGMESWYVVDVKPRKA